MTEYRGSLLATGKRENASYARANDDSRKKIMTRRSGLGSRRINFQTMMLIGISGSEMARTRRMVDASGRDTTIVWRLVLSDDRF